MLTVAVVCTVGCTKPEDPNDPNNGGNNGGGGNGGGNGGGSHEYVDLGLPSGLLWAACNVGADSPEDYGDYFAWAETTTKSVYNWSTYQYCMGTATTLTKYCSNAGYGYNGYTDNLTTLQTGDDAATAQWGSGWRMPTKEEWQELLANDDPERRVWPALHRHEREQSLLARCGLPRRGQPLLCRQLRPLLVEFAHHGPSVRRVATRLQFGQLLHGPLLPRQRSFCASCSRELTFVPFANGQVKGLSGGGARGSVHEGPRLAILSRRNIFLNYRIVIKL